MGTRKKASLLERAARLFLRYAKGKNGGVRVIFYRCERTMEDKMFDELCESIEEAGAGLQSLKIAAVCPDALLAIS